jgi:hypothetical protein
MNELFGFLTEYIERVVDPAGDLRRSEDDSLHLNMLLDDPTSAQIFAKTELGPDDIERMSLHAWVWYLDWRSSHAASPSPAFLDALYEAARGEPVVRYRIVDSVVRSARHLPAAQETPGPWSIDDIPMEWIKRQFRALLNPGESVREEFSGQVEHLDHAERRRQVIDIVSHLLDLGDDYSIGAIRALIRDDRTDRMDTADIVALVQRWLSETDGRIRLDWLRRLDLRDEIDLRDESVPDDRLIDEAPAGERPTEMPREWLRDSDQPQLGREGPRTE